MWRWVLQHQPGDGRGCPHMPEVRLLWEEHHVRPEFDAGPGHSRLLQLHTAVLHRAHRVWRWVELAGRKGCGYTLWTQVRKVLEFTVLVQDNTKYHIIIQHWLKA